MTKRKPIEEHKPRGRPSIYDESVADHIIEQMAANGRDMQDILSDDGMPGQSTVYRWMDDIPIFGQRIARAREALAEHVFHEVYDIARNITPESANADRVKIMALQWRAARLAPKRYGDRVQQDVTATVDVTTTVAADGLEAGQRAALRAALTAAAGAGGSKRGAKD